ncbi:flagellar hook-length control protein FliK [Rummeliibacillus sp. NPDC094406]|uniref:flagellar hook-length control protein FliK n=1 Tax=Rummeliibacillus sp. NPDC094406 TaxID=3364511 RepID=UPI00381CB57A
MNIELLKVSKTVKPEVHNSKSSSNSKGFAEVLTKANSSVSTKNQAEARKSDFSRKEIATNQSVRSDTKESQGSQATGVVQETPESKETQGSKEIPEGKEIPESKETKATTSGFKLDLSKGLEGLLGTVSKLVDDSKGEQTISIDDLLSIINASSLKELGATLGFKLEQQDFSGGLSLDNILQALGINKEDLQKALHQLTGNQAKAEDVWDMLAGIDQNQFTFIQNLMSSIKDDSSSKISKSQASQVLQFLKVVELVAPKTDLMVKQEYQSFQVKELLSTLASEVEQTAVAKSETQLTKSNDIQQLNIKLADTTANESVSTIQTTSKAATTTVSLTLPTTKAAQAEAFVKEFQAIMNRSQFSSNAAGTKLLIKLYPENLGSIRVELVQKDGIMTARFLASTNIGKQMLESQLQQLKQGLVNQNIQLDRIDVAQALNETNRHEKGQQQQFQNDFRQRSDDQQKQQKDEEEEKSNFNDFLMELEV